MLRSADAAAEAAVILRSEHFAAPAHQLVFEAVMRLADAGDPVDPASVLAELFRGRDAEQGRGDRGWGRRRRSCTR